MDKLFQKIVNLCFNRAFNFILFFALIIFLAREELDEFSNINQNSLDDKIEYNKEQGEKIINNISNSIKLAKYGAIKINKTKKTTTELNDSLKLSIKKIDNKKKEIDSNEIILYVKLDNMNQLSKILINKKIGDSFFMNGNSLFSSLTNVNSNNKDMYKVTIVDIVNDNN